MAKARVTFHEAALAEIVRSDGVRADMERRAELVLRQARSDAPVLSGEYRDNLHIERVTGSSGAEVLRVTAGTDHDIYVEAETGNLARALDAASD